MKDGDQVTGTLITDICPDPALLDAFADTFGTSFWGQHADGRVVGVQDVAVQNRCLDLVDYGLQDPHRVAAPVGERAARNIGAHVSVGV